MANATMVRSFDAGALELLARWLPADVEVELECLSYGRRELGGSVCGVDARDGEPRIVVEGGGVRRSASVGSVQSIRCGVGHSAELAGRVCRGLPHRTPVVLETRTTGVVHGLYAGVHDETGVICVDRHGNEHAVPVADVVAVLLECV